MSQSERRLAAIMYTDMVSYTALGQRDESLSLAVVEAQQKVLGPVLARHNGRVVKTMGDAFLIEFTNALEAARCAYDVQRSVREFNLALSSEKRIHLRVGIHLGDVVGREGDIFGDAVNIASRIEPLAEDGGVCLTQQVYDQVQNKLELPLESLGSKSLKNVSVPLEVYKMVMPWDEEKVIPPTKLDKRVAILPFANISPDPADEYLADGMTEELISTMSRIRDLSVIARTSVMGYKGVQKKISEVAKELEVGTVLEGSIRKAGDRLRITVQLIDSRTGDHLWVESYDRELKDVFAIQSDIASKIAEALRVRLAPGREPAGKHAENIEAYTLYLRGRSLWNRRDKEGVLGSLKLFQEAIRINPDYARAYTGLADAYTVATERIYVDRAEGMVRSKEAAMKAVELDDTLAEAHASLGLNLLSDLGYEDALRELRRAIELNPSYATAHLWYSNCLREIGRMKEAMEEIEKARELDPLSPMIMNIMGTTNALGGRLDDAIAIYDKLIENEPAFAPGYESRFYCFMFKGMKEKAYADLEAFHKLWKDEDRYRLGLAQLHGWFGEREKVLLIVEELIPGVGKSQVWEMEIAGCYAILGDRDEFFKWIDKAISTKWINAQDLRYSPIYDKVREDPRFPEIFKKLGLPY